VRGQKEGRRCNKQDNSRGISASRKIAAEIAARYESRIEFHQRDPIIAAGALQREHVATMQRRGVTLY